MWEIYYFEIKFNSASFKECIFNHFEKCLFEMPLDNVSFEMSFEVSLKCLSAMSVNEALKVSFWNVI